MEKLQRLLLLSAFALLVCSSVSHAQLSVGLRGGVNFANLDLEGDGEFAFKPKVRPSFAVLFHIPVSNAFAIQIEPGYSGRGARLDNKQSGVINGVPVKLDATGKLTNNYIEMPVFIQYRPKIGSLEGILGLGPELRVMTGGMKLRQESRQFVNGELIQEEVNETPLNGEDAFKKFDFGLAGGVGVAYPLGSVKLFAEGRYHFGLNNLNDPNDGPKAFNRGASAHIGVIFVAGK